jgi:hypothetical protein
VDCGTGRESRTKKKSGGGKKYEKKMPALLILIRATTLEFYFLFEISFTESFGKKIIV